MENNFIIKIFLLTGLLGLLFGVVFPAMVSSQSSEVVVAGIVSLFFLVMWGAVIVNDLLRGRE